MKPRTIAIIVVLVVVLVAIIAYAARNEPEWGHLEFWKAHLTESPEDIYSRSAGGYDRAADLALRRVEALGEAASPADHRLAASILLHNVVGQGEAEADTDVAEALRRRTAFDRAGEHLAAALGGLTPDAIARETAGDVVRLAGGEGRQTEGPPVVGPLINDALEYANRGVTILVANDPNLAYLAGDAGAAHFGNRLAAAAAERRNTAIAARREVAADLTQGPGSRAAAYLDLARTHTSDSQNSHDPSVNASKRAVVARLREDQGALDRLPSLSQIAEDVGDLRYSVDPRTGEPRPALNRQAADVVERAGDGDFSMAAAATDEEVLRRVWARADDPRNAANAASLRQAAFDAMVDCWERGIGADAIQCVDGRISRFVGSLALLDWDQRNWDVLRLEEHKNAIFADAARVIRERAQVAAESDNPKVSAVGRSYLATTAADLVDTDPDTEAAWQAETQKAITENIDKYVRGLDSGVIPAHMVADIKKEAAAAV